MWILFGVHGGHPAFGGSVVNIKLAPDERRLVPTPSKTSFILQIISKNIASSRKSVLKVFQIFP